IARSRKLLARSGTCRTRRSLATLAASMTPLLGIAARALPHRAWNNRPELQADYPGRRPGSRTSSRPHTPADAVAADSRPVVDGIRVPARDLRRIPGDPERLAAVAHAPHDAHKRDLRDRGRRLAPHCR